MNRTQTVLAVVLAVQVMAIAASSAVRRHEAQGAIAHPLLPALKSMQPEKIVIEGEDHAKLTLDRDGKNWRVASADGWPADASKVQELLGKLRRVEVRNPIATGKRVLDPLGVSDAKLHARVQIFADAKQTKPGADLIIGTSPSGGATHVRAGGDDAVYEARGIAAYDVRPDPAAWTESRLIDIPTESVIGIRIENASGTLELRKADGAWMMVSPAMPPSKKLVTSKVDDLVRAASTVSVAEPVGRLDAPAQGLDRPAAVVTVASVAAGKESSTPESTTLRIGHPYEKNGAQLYATRDGLGFTAAIWKSAVQQLLDARPETLTE